MKVVELNKTLCFLALEMQGNVVGAMTISDSKILDGDNIKVLIDVVIEGDCAILIQQRKRPTIYQGK